MSVETGNRYIDGHLSAKTMSIPAGTITNAMVNGSAAIDATKLEHQFAKHHYQTTGTAIVAAVEDIHIVQGATGEIVDFEAAITGAIATGADRTATIDLQRSTGGAAFATVCSVTIVLDDDSVLRVKESATLSTTSLVQGDILRIVVTVAGAAGSQGQGLVACVTLREDAQ